MALLRTSDRVSADVVYQDVVAIDMERSDLPAYLQNPDEADQHLVYHEGMEPTVFSVRALTAKEWRDARAKARKGSLDDAAAGEAALREFVLIACSYVTNLRGDGARLKMKPALVDKVIPPDVTQWLGNVILKLTKAEPDPNNMAVAVKRITQAQHLLHVFVSALEQAEPDEDERGDDEWSFSSAHLEADQVEALREALGEARRLLGLPQTESDHKALDDPKKS